MALEDLRQLTRGWLLDLADCVCPEEQIELLAQKADRHKEQIRRGYEALLRCRREMEHLHEKIATEEHKAAALPWQVEAYLQLGDRAAAWRAALELDQVRSALAEDRARLRRREREHRQQVAHLERERQTLGQMQLQLKRLASGGR